MKLNDDARKVIHDWRWGPHIDDPIERQEAGDVVIKKVMDTFNQLEEENETLEADKRLLMHVVHGRAMASSLHKHLKEE